MIVRESLSTDEVNPCEQVGLPARRHPCQSGPIDRANGFWQARIYRQIWLGNVDLIAAVLSAAGTLRACQAWCNEATWTTLKVLLPAPGLPLTRSYQALTRWRAGSTSTWPQGAAIALQTDRQNCLRQESLA